MNNVSGCYTFTNKKSDPSDFTDFTTMLTAAKQSFSVCHKKGTVAGFYVVTTASSKFFFTEDGRFVKIAPEFSGAS